MSRHLYAYRLLMKYLPILFQIVQRPMLPSQHALDRHQKVRLCQFDN